MRRYWGEHECDLGPKDPRSVVQALLLENYTMAPWVMKQMRNEAVILCLTCAPFLQTTKSGQK